MSSVIDQGQDKKEAKKITPAELVTIINNTDKKYSYENRDYLLVIKDQPGKPCALYICDCEETFWQKALDITFFFNLRAELNLASSLDIFASHFIQSLKNKSKVQRIKNFIRLDIELEIGEGLTMNCSTKIQNRTHFNNPDEFKKTLKKFLGFLYQAKIVQIQKQKGKSEFIKKEFEEKATIQQQLQKSKQAFIGNNKKIPTRKNRNLMNPEKKKRKNQGAKFGTGYTQDMNAQVIETFID